MKCDPRFSKLPRNFWAYVRIISERAGYTQRGSKTIKIPTQAEISKVLKSLNLNSEILFNEKNQHAEFGKLILEYFHYRAELLNNYVAPLLMNASQAKEVFEGLKPSQGKKAKIPLNKQKGEKKQPAYFTSSINILIDKYSLEHPCDFDPRHLTIVSKNGNLLRALARRVDGAFPSAINPIAIWEIKEYYYTTTFGSRVADGVYVTLLDGMELAELYEHEGIKVLHYLMIDSHYTWWECGKSYLCRIIDALNMGYIHEVLFGKEIIARLPECVTEWVALLKKEDPFSSQT